MIPVEVEAAGAGRRMQGEAVVPMMLPPFFMDSGIWPAPGVADAAAGSAEDEAAAAAAAHDRALAASRNHREAEKRRRERIKSHLDRLRAVLACDPKIDKASLLAKAVERVRDLKQRMAGIGEAAPAHLFPTEHDEIVVLASGGGAAAVFEASVCCDDRSDLLPELIETLRALRLRTLRAEMATLGGRVRNVLVLARDASAGADDDDSTADYSAGSTDGGDFLKEALRALVERPGVAAGDRPKRRRVVSDMNMQAAA
ncbi:transcription factor bHLH106-like [Oryza brachyantha]|uniref:transcription factor bHLH106-like n=1 Tax=Oryza brachyantha TaxID=4533 RepID=UPI001ADBC933|nr:transcription factor bHLH106-like [Oryza brachyantha]